MRGCWLSLQLRVPRLRSCSALQRLSSWDRRRNGRRDGRGHSPAADSSQCGKAARRALLRAAPAGDCMAQTPSPGSNPGRGDDTNSSDAGATYLSDAGALYTLLRSSGEPPPPPSLPPVASLLTAALAATFRPYPTASHRRQLQCRRGLGGACGGGAPGGGGEVGGGLRGGGCGADE